MSLRGALRHVVLSGLAAADSFQGKEQLISERSIVQVVNFHHLYAAEVDAFRDFLKWFCQRYELVSYSEAVRRVSENKIDRAYGAITFDDGLKSIVRAGTIMAEFGISGAFFVCPEITGETVPARLREFCVRSRMSYESDEFATWDDLAALKSQGHEVGNHTFSHLEMSKLTAAENVEQIAKAQDLLVSRLGHTRHFAWPFGRFESFGCSAAVETLKAEFVSIGSGERGAHAPETDALRPLDSTGLAKVCMRRDNLEACWPLAHIKYFLTKNAEQPVLAKQWWPDDWQLAKASISS